jgi:diacylglycerol kinase family enzyme
MLGVLVNPRSGYVAEHGVDHMQDLICDAVPDARIHVLDEDDDVAARVDEFRSAGATCIAAVGGDGTICSVAANLVDTEVALGVIPGGTLNHFARDVGVGRDVPEAVQILARGNSIAVDVATVNDRVFLNNSSIGLYPELVYMREAGEKHLSKWQAMLRACLLVVRKAKWTDLDLRTDDEMHHVRTRMLFVGNNQYELRLLNLGRRESLQEGTLCCFVLDAPNRWRMIQTAFTSLRTDERERRFFHSLTTTELTVAPRQEQEVQVATDGEVFDMRTPLVYKIKPQALRVVTA